MYVCKPTCMCVCLLGYGRGGLSPVIHPPTKKRNPAQSFFGPFFGGAFLVVFLTALLLPGVFLSTQLHTNSNAGGMSPWCIYGNVYV